MWAAKVKLDGVLKIKRDETELDGPKGEGESGRSQEKDEYDWNMLYEFFKEIILKEEGNKMEEAK